jgi:hypothetical protein
MKTLREYIDQLDEISRRDFLKGAGATAGLAAMGAAAPAKATDFTSYPRYGEYGDPRGPTRHIINDVLVLYYYLKLYRPNDPLIQEIQNAIQNFFKSNPENKDFVKTSWAEIGPNFAQFQKDNPDAYAKRGKEFFSTARQILAKFNNLSEFNENISLDSVSRIQELISYK